MLLVSEGMEQASESGEERPVESDHSEFDVELSGDEDSEDIAGRIPTAGKIEMRNILSGAVPVPTVTILDRSAQSGDLRRKDLILYNKIIEKWFDSRTASTQPEAAGDN